MSFVKQIRLTAAEFAAQPGLILDNDQIGFEIDTKKFKIGDSSTTWANLLYADPTAVIAALALKADSLTAADATARLALTGLTRGARVYQTDTGFWYELTNAAAPSDAASWQAQPKVYKATLTQTSTNPPVATVQENGLGQTVTEGYTSPGIFTLTAGGAVFTADKTEIFTGGAADYNTIVTAQRTSTTVITIYVLNTDGLSLENGQLTETAIRIEVYP